MPDGGLIKPTTVEFHGVVAIHEDVVEDLVILTATEKGSALHFVEHVAEYLGAAHAIIHVNTHGTHADAAGMVNKVVADPIAAISVIASGIDGTDIAGFEGDVVNFIELEQVVVAVEQDGTVRVVVDEIVRGAQANAVELDRRHIAF